MATSNDPRAKPMAEPDKRQSDDEEPWRHAPVAPRDEDPLESLGRSISDAVTGTQAVPPAKPKA